MQKTPQQEKWDVFNRLARMVVEGGVVSQFCHKTENIRVTVFAVTYIHPSSMIKQY